MSYAIGDKVLFRPMGNGENSTPYEGVVTERACMGYVKVRITDGKWHEFHDWVNADTHVICKLTPVPKPKKLVTRPRVECGSSHNYRIVNGVIERQWHLGGGEWERSAWNTKPIGEAHGGDVASIRAIANLIERPTETVEVDDE